MTDYLIYFFIFPGFSFLFVSGMFVSWMERKITARLQWRVGPVLLQPFYDFRKLMFKEIILPEKGNAVVFALAPLAAVSCAVLISDILILGWIIPEKSFVGDILVLIYLFAVPPAVAVLGASASGNALASVGASREIKAVAGYELPFILAVTVPVIKSGSVSTGAIILSQQGSAYIFSLSGILAFIAAFFCVLAKLGIAPFDMAEAETELAGGTQIEYSGPLLALWKLCRMMLWVLAPLFLIALFWPSGGWFGAAIKYTLLALIMIIIKNTNPRVRIDQAIRFFWTYAALIAAAASFLALAGY